MEGINRTKLIKRSFLFFILSISIMFVFEFSQQALFPEITTWGSHLITILFVSAISSYLSYHFILSSALGRMCKNEIKRVCLQKEINRLNSSLDTLINEKREALQKINIELIKAKKKVEDSDKLKTTFFQHISHEIRTPLNGIIGFSELLYKHFENKNKLVYCSDIIRQCGFDLLDIINDTLEISKIETGQAPVHPTNVNLQEVIDELVTAFFKIRQEVNKPAIELRLSYSAGLENLTFVTDILKFKQIWVNLIYNAFKYTESGFIELGSFETCGNYVKFYVSDSGMGFKKGDLPLLFKEFVQIYNFTGKHQRSGLGLAITKRLVELLKGKIFVNSMVGNGSIFVFTLPLNPNLHSIKTQEALAMTNSADHIERSILIVAQDEPITIFFWKQLYKTGLQIRFAETCCEAIIQINDGLPVDILIVDTTKLCEDDKASLKILKKGNLYLKIFAQQRQFDQFMEQDGLFDEYLSKPINENEFLSKIEFVYSSK